MRSSRPLLVSLGCLLLLAGGCIRSIQPILKDEQVTFDPALVGEWASSDGGGIQVQPSDDHKSYKVHFTNEKGKTGDFIVRLGTIGQHQIAEIQPELPQNTADEYAGHLIPTYSFIAISQTKPQIKGALMSYDWFGKYIEQHRDELDIADLGGSSKEGKTWVITSSVDDIQKFLLRHWNDQGAWDEDKVLFARPGDPTTREAKKE